jgi:multiple sugar transport system permease protein
VQVFSGLDQYKSVLTNSSFDSSMLRVAWYALLLVPLMAVIAVTLALLLDASALRVARFFRTLFFLPYAVPTVIAVLMWGFLYTPSTSPLGEFHIPINPLGSGLILASLANIGIWAWGGFNVILMTTALASVPEELIEAGRIDGATALQTAWHIKLPLIRPTIIMSVVLGIIGTLQLFTEPVVLQTLSGAITNNFTPNMFAYNALTAGNYSYAAAAAVTLAFFGFILSFGFLRIARRTVHS